MQKPLALMSSSSCPHYSILHYHMRASHAVNGASLRSPNVILSLFRDPVVLITASSCPFRAPPTVNGISLCPHRGLFVLSRLIPAWQRSHILIAASSCPYLCFLMSSLQPPHTLTAAFLLRDPPIKVLMGKVMDLFSLRMSFLSQNL